MRLSEAKITYLSKQIADLLIKNGWIKDAFPTNLKTMINRIISKDLKREDEIDLEAQRILGTYSRKIEKGTQEWEMLFQKTKEEIAARWNYIL